MNTSTFSLTMAIDIYATVAFQCYKQLKVLLYQHTTDGRLLHMLTSERSGFQPFSCSDPFCSPI